MVRGAGYRVMTPRISARIVFASALYDLLVTLPFATPWSAAWTLTQLRALHAKLGLGGTALPALEPTALMFVSFFGTVVTLWAVVRLRSPSLHHGRVDTVGRAAFSAWMAWALLQGASHFLLGMLALELGWFLVQGWAVLSRTPAPRAAAVAAS
jgi:hypothetical protein